MNAEVARSVLADLLRLRPAPGAVRVALRAASTMLAALSVLAAFGRIDLALYATFGAFASVYGGGVPYAGRWRRQTAVGSVLVAAVTVGALVGVSPEREWIGIPVAALAAGGAAVLSDRFRWRPPGPLFVVFAVAACASVPTTVLGVGAAFLVAGATAVVAVGLGVAEGTVGSRHAPAVVGPYHPTHRQVVQAIRCVVVVAVAGLLATASGIGHPYWAMVSAVVPLTIPTLRAQLVRGLHRAIGTALGVVAAAGLLLVPLPTVAVIMVVVVLQGLAELMVPRNYGLALIFITCLALLLGQLADAQPVGTLIADRLLETLIGVVIGVVGAVITRDRSAGRR